MGIHECVLREQKSDPGMGMGVFKLFLGRLKSLLLSTIT